MKAYCTLALLCSLLLTGASHAFQETAVTCISAHDAGKREDVSPPPFLADALRKEEILRYAKGVFLARLGFAETVAPPEFLAEVQRACFVTFFSGKRVVACFGGFYPRMGNVAAEIEENVRMALLFDPRARSIDRKTALSCDVQITFPGEPVAIKSYAEVNPLREGLLIENDRQGVAVVPGEAKTASWAFREAMRRLGEKDPARVRIFRFQGCAVSSRR